MLKNLNSNSFEKEVIESTKPVLVDFYAEWCGPCKMLAPVLEKVANANEQFDIVKINTDQNHELVMEYDIHSVPTMMVFKDGKVAEVIMGFKSESELNAIMGKYNN